MRLSSEHGMGSIAQLCRRPRSISRRSAEVDCLGRRAGNGAPLAADPTLDRSEQPRSPTSRGEDGKEKKGLWSSRFVPVTPATVSSLVGR